MKRTFYPIFLLPITILLMACPGDTPSGPEPEPEKTLMGGTWRGILHIDSTNKELYLPFNFEVNKNSLVIRNADEQIEVTEVIYKQDSVNGDSVFITLPVFGSKIEAAVLDDVELSGAWYNPNKGPDYAIPFIAFQADYDRFTSVQNNLPNSVDGRWKVTFSPGTEDEYLAIGEFQQGRGGNRVTGTFITETGDYRYLEGNFDGMKMKLSCFDGAHAFLFHADAPSQNLLKGTFWSGNHWKEPWEAVRDTSFELTPMDELTGLKPGYETLEFSFPNLDNKEVSLADEKYKGKATIVQILGTWCPNCMDETRFLVEMHKKYHKEGLEIIGIDFERNDDFELYKKNVTRLKKDLGVDYEILFGGPAKKSESSKALPALEHIMSYPTAVYIDKEGKVREIHTGFYGPGTGEYYVIFTSQTERLIRDMLGMKEEPINGVGLEG